MKTNGLREIIGKTISGIVIKKAEIGKSAVIFQLHLVFSDNTCLEMYTQLENIHFAGGLDRGGLEEARHYSSDVLDIVYQVYLDEHGNKIERNGP